MKENKADIAAVAANGTSNGKRKLEKESEGLESAEVAEDGAPPAKKKKKHENNETEVEPVVDSSDKFSWNETIRNILSAKNNELKLKKLKKKVLKKYQSLTGSEWSDKAENKFNKKINKLKGVVIDNDDKVRLID